MINGLNPYLLAIILVEHCVPVPTAIQISNIPTLIMDESALHRHPVNQNRLHQRRAVVNCYAIGTHRS